MRARLRLRHAAARFGADPAWAHRIRADADGREPRPRAVVSPAVSRRRLAALRTRQPQAFGVARLLPRSQLRPRRHAGGLRGAGEAAARTQDPALKVKVRHAQKDSAHSRESGNPGPKAGSPLSRGRAERGELIA